MGIVFAAIAILVGALAVKSALLTAQRMRGSQGWPTVPGRILERGLGEHSARVSYYPRVRYAYSVDGREHVNDQIYAAARIARPAPQTQRFVDSLPDPIPVHYDPADPADSYLLPTPLSAYWVMLIGGTIAIVVGLVQLVVLVIG